ncbi:MAG TPA: MoaD/ThiS family protein [Azospirillum sp.]|nr:MoaD/ThiS family protein [Azospirillum sp.]
MQDRSIGDNSGAIRIQVEVRLFNSLVPHGQGRPVQTVPLPAGSTVGDVIRRFGIPPRDVYLVLINGRDPTPTLGDVVNQERTLEDGDVVALSGPVPFSWGYGAPVV